MSADNYYLIRKHPDGGFVAVMGFMSNEQTPEIDPQKAYRKFDTPDDAIWWADNEYSEYGVSVHPECNEYPSEVRLAAVNTVALELFEAWSKAEPNHGVTKHPASYMASFADMARHIIDKGMVNVEWVAK
ncbi:hypothetical protein [Aeromicrobium sp. 179-A 4D2 NHS]|uniref:hypothetical protein n=1 Tax=Aeromicrobium sp. 179-A 4D2 NHS TaxID=3142375 RepID=UPI00399F1C41